MRKHIGGDDNRLEKWADDISSRTCLRDYVNGCSHDFNRPATDEGRAVLRPIIYGALLALNWGESIRRGENEYSPGCSAVLDTAEFVAISAMRRFTKDGEEYQSYDGIYCPLCRVLREWPKE